MDGVSVECGVWCMWGECAVLSVGCGVWSCGVCGVCVECEVWSVWRVECGVHGV